VGINGFFKGANSLRGWVSKGLLHSASSNLGGDRDAVRVGAATARRVATVASRYALVGAATVKQKGLKLPPFRYLSAYLPMRTSARITI
jgi:hypothetical protein